MGRNRLEQTLNRSLFRQSKNLWFRLFWAKIRSGLMSYSRSTYFPIFFQKTARTHQIQESHNTALTALESFLNRQWDDLGYCTFSEVAFLVNEMLKSCHQMLDCPEDLFAEEKQQQNEAALSC